MNVDGTGQTNITNTLNIVEQQPSWGVCRVPTITPTITWSDPADIVYGTALGGTQLNATASVPGSFIYTPASGAVLGAGLHPLTATFTPTDTADYTTAPAVAHITVNAATLTVTPADE